MKNLILLLALTALSARAQNGGFTATVANIDTRTGKEVPIGTVDYGFTIAEPQFESNLIIVFGAHTMEPWLTVIPHPSIAPGWISAVAGNGGAYFPEWTTLELTVEPHVEKQGSKWVITFKPAKGAK